MMDQCTLTSSWTDVREVEIERKVGLLFFMKYPIQYRMSWYNVWEGCLLVYVFQIFGESHIHWFKNRPPPSKNNPKATKKGKMGGRLHGLGLLSFSSVFSVNLLDYNSGQPPQGKTPKC